MISLKSILIVRKQLKSGNSFTCARKVSAVSYDESNEYENTAYQFGGLADQNDFPSIDINNQILDQYPGWWK